MLFVVCCVLCVWCVVCCVLTCVLRCVLLCVVVCVVCVWCVVVCVDVCCVSGVGLCVSWWKVLAPLIHLFCSFLHPVFFIVPLLFHSGTKKVASFVNFCNHAVKCYGERWWLVCAKASVCT